MIKVLMIILKSPKTFFGLFLIATLISCAKSPDEAISIVKESIKAHGGQKEYDALKAVSFVKTTRLFLENGKIESEVVQTQTFQLKPDYRVQIEWNNNGRENVVFFDGKKAIKTVDGVVVKDSMEISKAKNAAKAAAYVFFQPFELININTYLSLEDEVELNDSISAQTVSVKYEGDTESSDKWRYYFNSDNMLIANSVVLTDHNSLIENLKFQEVSGLIFNKYRKSYRVDNQLNKQYLRAEYFYDEISVVK